MWLLSFRRGLRQTVEGLQQARANGAYLRIFQPQKDAGPTDKAADEQRHGFRWYRD